METIQQKWDELNAKVDRLSDAFINDFFTKLNIQIPERMYHLQSYNSINELQIDKVSVVTKPWRPSIYGKRPTRKDVAELQSYLDNFSPKSEDILLGYTESIGTMKSSGAYRFVKIGNEEKRVSFDRETLLPLQEELRQKYEPREGHAACTYCGKQVPIETMVDYTVIARQYPNMRKTAKYCSKTCGVHDQMAHEG